MKTDLLAEKTALVMQNKKWRGCVMSGSLSTVHWSTVPGLCRLSRDILEVYVVANLGWSVLVLMLDAATLEYRC